MFFLVRLLKSKTNANRVISGQFSSTSFKKWYSNGLPSLNVEIITEYVDEKRPLARVLAVSSIWHYFSFRDGYNCELMNILVIVLSLIGAYLFFVAVCYILIRLIFPKIELDDSAEMKPIRNVKRYAPSDPLRKQKNLAY